MVAVEFGRVISPRLPLLMLLLLLVSVGCGVRKGAPEWIGADAAVVRCTVAGPNLALPRLFDEVPSPMPPAGLYARVMDPIALDQLGFERDRVVCASLQAPELDQLERAREAIAHLHEQRRELLQSTRKLGACRCEYADALNARGLMPGCTQVPSKPDCELEPELLRSLADQLAPFEATLASTEVPRMHWRLVGRSDRPGRFVARHEELIARHHGGSEVFVKGYQLPPQPGTKLLGKLLAMEQVVAVVRQDGGRGLLVIRELGELLILDHFAYPDWSSAGLRRIDPELQVLLAHAEDAQLDRYRAALEPPRQRRELLLDPRKGYTVELDHAALERVDRALLVAAEYVELAYDEAAELRELPPLLIDRIAHQVPYGTDGKLLRARLRSSERGREWLASVRGQDLLDAVPALGNDDRVPSFEPAVPGFAQLFTLRGQPIEQALFAGPSGLPKLLLALAAADARALAGKVEDFEVALPSGPLPGGYPTRPGLQQLRERLSIAPHSLAVELVDGGRTLALELAPR